MSEGIPPVLVLSGTDHFSCRRKIKEVSSTQRSEGWELLSLNDVQKKSISDIIEGHNSFLFSRPSNTLVVLNNIKDLNVEVLNRFHKSPKPSLSFLVYKEGKLVGNYKKLDKGIKARLIMDLPPFYKQEEGAIEFCIEEAKKRGKNLSLSLAKVLVQLCGVNLGYLCFEVEKLSIASQAEDITSEDLKNCLCPMFEVSVDHLIKSVLMRNKKRSSLALKKIYQSHSSDPTIKVCRYLASRVMLWLRVAYLDSSGYNVEEASSKMGVHSFYYRKSLLPILGKWDIKSLRKLLKSVVSSEESVKNGVINPQIFLTYQLLSCF